MIRGFRLLTNKPGIGKWVFVYAITDTYREVLIMKEHGGTIAHKVDETVITPVTATRYILGLESDTTGHLCVTLEPTDAKLGKFTLIRADVGLTGLTISHHISNITVNALLKL